MGQTEIRSIEPGSWEHSEKHVYSLAISTSNSRALPSREKGKGDQMGKVREVVPESHVQLRADTLPNGTRVYLDYSETTFKFYVSLGNDVWHVNDLGAAARSVFDGYLSGQGFTPEYRAELGFDY